MKLNSSQKILILGFGKSGFAMAKYLMKNNINFIINDSNDLSNSLEAKELVNSGIEIIYGSHPINLLDDIDIIIKNPGIPHHIEILKEAKKRNIIITNEIEIAYEYFKDKKIIAITGTNGKTTVTSMINHMLLQCNKKVIVGGNIGIPAIDLIDEKFDYIVLELSSFQLKSIINFKADINIILNLGVDHIDYHLNIDDYHNSKLNLLKNLSTELVLLNSKDKRAKNIKYNNIKFFDEIDISSFINGEISQHTIDNIAACIEVGKNLKLNDNCVKNSINNFSGVEHRFEILEEKNGIKFINDSKATNAEATLVAIKDMDNIILLCGGMDKKDDFSILSKYKKNIKKVYSFGENKDEFTSVFDNVDLCNNLEEAFDFAIKSAKIGDVVLLSPASASWDQFNDYQERGNLFKKIYGEIE